MNLDGKHIHFMGIGGIGMSALAQLAMTTNATVSGCDREENENTKRLKTLGINIAIGHDPAHAESADTVVYTSAIPPEHPERKAAGDNAVRRGSFLAEIMTRYRSVGICGTHGKTTTTWILAHILLEAGLDPTFVLGGIAPDLNSNLHIGASDLLVAELDESDGSFLEPHLAIAVITNIESDHLHHYGDFETLRAAFRHFANGVSEKGILIACADDPQTQTIINTHPGAVISYGFSETADWRAESVSHNGTTQQFNLYHNKENRGRIALRLPGHHNIQNALAAWATADALGVPHATLATALASCQSVGRRMERVGTVSGAAIYSDYAHHPTEVQAAIRGAKQLHPGSVRVIFQPHLYSRTRDYADAFAKALSEADAVTLLPIYPAREEALPGIESELIAEQINQANNANVAILPLADVWDALPSLASDMDAVLLMGAGDIDTVARKLREGDE